ncbi:MAG: response regulator [Planctomycetes bacterium]|nr:response regulator [Planctomycetota bacterium]
MMNTQITVLVVDDEKGIRDFLNAALVDCGYNVITARNGAEGMSALTAGKIDIVLTDIVMPEADGFAVLKKALTVDPLIKVIMMSGDLTAENYARSFNEGAFDFIGKPFGAEVIIRKVNQALMK